ncbi:MAG: helix-turn-helix transcriptional regulator [Saprospiraceae bacterium]|nr:helix-turn-helix transcriptional regulator [Saprospiraceae bacterium]
MMKKYFSDHLPEKLRQLRAYHQFPQRYVAHILNCSQYGYSKLERGQMRLSETRLSQLAQLYRLPPVDLLDKSSDELIRQIIDGKPVQEAK